MHDLPLKSSVLQHPLPRYIFRFALEMARQSAGFTQAICAGPDDRAVWDELQNKIEAFALFEYADFELGAAGNEDLSLRELVHRAFRLGPYRSVWVLEGLGSYYTRRQLRRGRLPDLCGDQSTLPPRGLMPLHTGMGLALAESVLEAMSQNTSQNNSLLSQFVSLCHNSSQDGYWGAAFEALGLVAKTLYPHLIVPIDSHLRSNDELLAYFWHGIGRGVYFVPTNILPFLNGQWRALNMCLSEPPHETGRRNAIAGLVWAITLINIRQPEILAAFLKHLENDVGDGDAVANGICSALMIWLDSAVDDHYLRAIGKYVPNASTEEGWKKYVKDNCEWALDYYPAFKSRQRMGELFRCQAFRDLARE